MEDYELQEAFEADPLGVTARVVAEASAVAAAEILQMHDQRQDEQDSRVRDGQIESASIQAREELVRRYGKAEVDRLGPAIGERLQNSPHLLPEDALTSPSALVSALDDAYRLTKAEVAEQEAENHWETIKAQKANVPRVYL